MTLDLTFGGSLRIPLIQGRARGRVPADPRLRGVAFPRHRLPAPRREGARSRRRRPDRRPRRRRRPLRHPQPLRPPQRSPRDHRQADRPRRLAQHRPRHRCRPRHGRRPRLHGHPLHPRPRVAGQRGLPQRPVRGDREGRPLHDRPRRVPRQLPGAQHRGRRPGPRRGQGDSTRADRRPRQGAGALQEHLLRRPGCGDGQ